MIFIVLFTTAAGTSALASRLLPAAAFGAIFAPVVLVAMWLNDRIGTSNLIVESWQWLSGVRSPGEVIVECDPQPSSGWYFLVLLITWVLVLGIAAAALAGLVCTPLGLIAAPFAGIHALATRSESALSTAVSLLLFGPAAVIVAGLGFRLEHAITGWGCTL